LFANESYRALRAGLLSGLLLPACRSCRVVQEADVEPAVLRRRVEEHLNRHGIATENADLTRARAFVECNGNITNKCNLSCIYCSHSGPEGHSGTLSLEMGREEFLATLSGLCEQGLESFSFCGTGEITIYPGWRDLCLEILRRYPSLKLRMVTNFSTPLSDDDLAILTRFDLIHVSCDTLEAELFARLRKGGRLAVLLENLRRLMERLSSGGQTKVALNVMTSDEVVDHLEGLFRKAASLGLFVHLSPLFDFAGSLVSLAGGLQPVTATPPERSLHVREVLADLPRRMKAENPLCHVWEYKNLYRAVSERADRLSPDEFVPGPDEAVYTLFHSQANRPGAGRLRKLWRSFDVCARGVYMAVGQPLALSLPLGRWRVSLRASWCRERVDGNLSILDGDRVEVVASGALTVVGQAETEFDHVLLQVVALATAADADVVAEQTELRPPADGERWLAREGFLLDEQAVAARIANSGRPISIWCAGFHARRLLTTTPLSSADVRFVIDRDSSRQGEPFCGHRIQPPEALAGFQGSIVVAHASYPERVEQQIRALGIPNEVLIL
jgi:hypothetical protein